MAVMEAARDSRYLLRPAKTQNVTNKATRLLKTKDRVSESQLV
jgi:hypothetical protein